MVVAIIIESMTGPLNGFNIILGLITIVIFAFLIFKKKKEEPATTDHGGHGDGHDAPHTPPAKKTAGDYLPQMILFIFLIWVAYQYIDWNYETFGSRTLQPGFTMVLDLEPGKPSPVINVPQDVDWTSTASSPARLKMKDGWLRFTWREIRDVPGTLTTFKSGKNRKFQWTSPTGGTVTIHGYWKE